MGFQAFKAEAIFLSCRASQFQFPQFQTSRPQEAGHSRQFPMNNGKSTYNGVPPFSASIIFVCLFAASRLVAQSVSLPLPEHPTSFDTARVVNQFISLGEEGAVKEMKRLCEASRKKNVFLDHNMAEQISWICRIIFMPKEGTPIRAPRFGALHLPWNTMEAEDWPLYPIAESEGVYFILSQGYSLAGLAEDPQNYIDYCRSMGSFRTTPVKIPTKETAEYALMRLLSSNAWKKIKWKDSKWHEGGGGFSYDMSEASVIAYLKAQTGP